MIEIIIIKKNGDVESKRVKEIKHNNIYKFCNYKSDKDFSKVHDFNINNTKYTLYGKEIGKATQENKYELPPPIDTTLYFGTLCIVKTVEEEYVNLTVEEWNNTYENLFGGFEDIGDEDDETRSMDSEVYEDEDYTEEGYLKDGFVISDNELEEEEYLDYESE